ncbi:hypothetical protein PLICRDRAFT_39065 [Plicaturopsis crispa FD-325 SS-3]|nr:hypothetical protein PLICRDRAFT_39065 [Plicaturopsis crispa FD-325 SS-3]
MARHHFLCCLPLRLGVILMSFFQSLLAAATGGLLWWLVIEHFGDIDKAFRAAVIGYAVVLTILAIFAFLGFIGALRKRSGYVAAYGQYLGYLLGVEIVISIIYLIAFFLNHSAFLRICTRRSTNQDIIDSCNQSLNSSKWGMVVLTIVPLLIQGYNVLIVSQYANELAERDDRRTMMMNNTASGFAYKPVDPHDDVSRPLTQPDNTYAYSDATHSFGNTKQGPFDPYAQGNQRPYAHGAPPV